MKSNDKRIGTTLYVYERELGESSREFKHAGRVTNVVPQEDERPNLIYYEVEDERRALPAWGRRELTMIFELVESEWPQEWKGVIETCDEKLRHHIGVCLQRSSPDYTTLFDRRTGNTLYFIEESRQSGDVTLLDEDRIWCGKGTLTHCETRFFVGCEELEVFPEEFEHWA